MSVLGNITNITPATTLFPYTSNTINPSQLTSTVASLAGSGGGGAVSTFQTASVSSLTVSSINGAAPSGGGGITPAAAQYSFFTSPLTSFTSDGSTSVFASRSADSIYNLSNRISYTSATGRFAPTTGNTGIYCVIISFSWRYSSIGIGPIGAYIYQGTSTIISQGTLTCPITYSQTTLDYTDSGGNPASMIVYTNPVRVGWTRATLSAVYNASTISQSVSLNIDTTGSGPIDIQNATITYYRIG